MSDYKITIGLEIHVALKTKSKLFSRSACDFDSDKFSFFDAAIPGMLPVLSEEPVKMALKFATSVNAEVPAVSIFERKHYFYPDLPLGYQITQQHQPIMIGGKVPIEVDGKKIEVQIEHAHLECDAAKSMHDKYADYTAIDLSRGSSPLLEIVTTPCMHSTKEAKLYAQTVCDLVKYLGICDGKLEEGSFRVDASISLSKTEVLGTRVEIKNISSFSFLQAALDYEIERQREVLDSGGSLIMETRLFDEKTMETQSMRKKETVHEYRYMPDPDIIPLVLDQQMLSQIRSDSFIYYFTEKEKLVQLFDSCQVKVDSIPALLSGHHRDIWMSIINDSSLHTERVLKLLAFWIPEAYSRVDTTKIITLEDVKFLDKSGLQAKECKEALSLWLTSDKSLKDCLPTMISEDEVERVIIETLSELSDQVIQYKAGQEKLFKFIIGKIMAKLKGKAQASTVSKITLKHLKQ